MVSGSEQGGLEAETAWPDAAKSSLLPRRWKKAVASDQLPSSELAAPQPELLARQKLSATTLKCPGSSGGANLQLSGRRRSAELGSYDPASSLPEAESCDEGLRGLVVPPSWVARSPSERGGKAGGGGMVLAGGHVTQVGASSIGWLRPPGRTEANTSSGPYHSQSTLQQCSTQSDKQSVL